MTVTEQRYRKVWQTVGLIPRGQVSTYGQVAELAGLVRGARLVGRALGAAPASLDLPWHRVLNSQGRISLPPDSPSYRRQRRRLENEGVTFVNGRVNLKTYGWHEPLDALLWGEPVAGQAPD